MASTIEDIISEITEYVDSCKPQMFSGSNIIVNRDDMDNLLDELKRATPVEIERYQRIIQNQEQILADAQRKAEAIVAAAQVKEDELVAEHKIMQEAYARGNQVINSATATAQDMLNKAQMDANEIRASAMQYADDLLKGMQEVLVRSMDTTRRSADSYLTTMQGYLDVVTKNRLELNPNVEAAIPNQKVAASGVGQVQQQAQPAQQQAAHAPAANANAAAKQQQPAGKGQPQAKPQAKDNKGAASAGKSVADIPEGFFNKD